MLTVRIDLRLTTSISKYVWWLILIMSAAESPIIAMAEKTIQSPQTERERPKQPEKQPEKQAEKQAKQSPKQPAISEEGIKEARELLGALRYWVNQDAVGLDVSLRHAVIAFQKVESRPRTGILTEEELEAIRASHRPQPRESGDAHIEIDLCRQVLFVVDDDGEVSHILPVSTGSGKCFTEGGRTRRAITPTGRFKVTRKVEGWRKSPLGLLYYPNYIYDGVAIHGNPSVPVQPASHGCIRIPMFAAKEFYRMAITGTVVIIYDSNDISPPITPP